MIHQFKIFDMYMALDVNSGAVHILDSMANNVLSCFNEKGELVDRKINTLKQEYGEEDIAEVISELESLKTQGLLFSEDPYEKAFSHRDSPTVVKASTQGVSSRNGEKNCYI